MKRFLTLKLPHFRSQTEYSTKNKNASKLLRIWILPKLLNLLQRQFHIKLETQVVRRASGRLVSLTTPRLPKKGQTEKKLFLIFQQSQNFYFLVCCSMFDTKVILKQKRINKIK